MKINSREIKGKTRTSKLLGCICICPLLLCVILLLGFHKNRFQKEPQVKPLKEVKFNHLCLPLEENTLHPCLCAVPVQLINFKRQLGFLLLRQGYWKFSYSEKLKNWSWLLSLPLQAPDPLSAPQEVSILCDHLYIFPDECAAECAKPSLAGARGYWILVMMKKVPQRAMLIVPSPSSLYPIPHPFSPCPHLPLRLELDTNTI